MSMKKEWDHGIATSQAISHLLPRSSVQIGKIKVEGLFELKTN